jgi:uncharacterized hydrophobic protein (TIGR00271 family)
VLQLRLYGSPTITASAAAALRPVPGIRHLGISEPDGGGAALLTADLRSDAGDRALSALAPLGLPPESVTLVRFETLGPSAETESVALVWADVLSQARARARMPARYFVLMSVAGVVAAFGVVNRSPILVVGAMAISPDLLPVTAACTGIVLRRVRLVLRGLAALVAGLAVACAAAAAIGLFLDLFDLLPGHFTIGEIPAAQTHVSAATIIVAFSAGIAGMLAVETRASSAVGVAISVTTIPAAAYLGVAVGIGELGKAWSAVSVLVVNIVMMLAGGSVALAVQRAAAARVRSAP